MLVYQRVVFMNSQTVLLMKFSLLVKHPPVCCLKLSVSRLFLLVSLYFVKNNSSLADKTLTFKGKLLTDQQQIWNCFSANFLCSADLLAPLGGAPTTPATAWSSTTRKPWQSEWCLGRELEDLMFGVGYWLPSGNLPRGNVP